MTNDKGIGARGAPSTINKGPGTSPDPSSVTGHNTYDDTGSMTAFAMPSTAGLATTTHQVFTNNNWENLLASTPIKNSTAAPGRRTRTPRRSLHDQARIPDRPGEPDL